MQQSLGKPLSTELALSIIIVSWNTRDLLAQCLKTVSTEIERLQPLSVETVVVDNVSTDDSVEMIKTEFPWVRLIANQENLGFAGANNQAIRQSTGRYILLLNPDTEIKPGAIEALIHSLDTQPTIGAVGPHTLNSDGSLQTSCYPTPTVSRELWRLFHLDRFHPYGAYQMATWDLEKPRQVDALLGACILLRRSVLEKIGLMDEGYFMYSEEIDLCHRIQRGGWSLYWVPQAKIIHYGGQSTGQVADKMFLRLYQSKLMFIRKHYGQLAAWLYKCVLFSATTARLLSSPVAWLEQAPKRQRHLTLANQYWQLVKALPGM